MKKYFIAFFALSLGLIAVGCSNQPGKPTPEPTATPKSDYILALGERYKDYQEVSYGLDITLRKDPCINLLLNLVQSVVSKNKPVI